MAGGEAVSGARDTSWRGRGGNGERDDLPGLRGTQRPRNGVLLGLRRLPRLGRPGGGGAGADAAVAPRPATAPPPAPQTPPAAADQPPAARTPAAAPPSGPPAGQPGPIVAPDRSRSSLPAQQIAGQPAARAWNAAAPTFGTQLPGGCQAPDRSPGTLGGCSRVAWPGSGWGGQEARANRRTTRRVSRRRPSRAYQAPPEPPPPTEGPCPRCGVVNGASLRFCRKCGLALRGPTLHDGGGADTRRRRNGFRGGADGSSRPTNTRRAARAAYRHSLPVRYRLIRWVLALLGDRRDRRRPGVDRAEPGRAGP